MFQQVAAENDFELDQSEDSTVFTTATMDTYDAIVMLQTSGMVWDTDAQRQAIQTYVRAGNGVVAIHNTPDMGIEAQFPWWDEIINGGAHMPAHSPGSCRAPPRSPTRSTPPRGPAGAVGAHRGVVQLRQEPAGLRCTCW